MKRNNAVFNGRKETSNLTCLEAFNYIQQYFLKWLCVCMISVINID